MYWLSPVSYAESTDAAPRSVTSPGWNLMSASTAAGATSAGNGSFSVAALVPAILPKTMHSPRLPPELYWKAQMPPGSPAP